ncbi:MAG: electron transfer flavoprotein subunit alpha/FixB family protein [Bacteroidales bacterium]|nr:electron transfer flavoprotein subunit alpha/FixB family protein [Bacteroidales bacterium]
MAVLVYTENWDGAFKKQSFELVSFASRIAELQNDELIVLSIGTVSDDELKKLSGYGADKILKADGDDYKNLDNQVYTRLITEAVSKYSATVVLLAHNNTGKAIAPRIAVRLNAGLVTAANQIPESLEPFVIRKKVFSGKAFVKVEIKTAIKVLTLAQNSVEFSDKPRSFVVETFTPDSILSATTTVRSVNKQTGQVLLTDAEIVVSGGRGMRAAENWGPIEELAEILGAATACSRPVSDEGWRPHTEHTGQTGKIIAPNIYFAFGISGAIQHLAGVSSSKCIVAVNTDPDAPIFEAADYGIVGDAIKILPDLVNAVREIKS